MAMEVMTLYQDPCAQYVEKKSNGTKLLIFEKKAILSDVIEWHQKEGGINNVISYVSQDLQSGHDAV